MGQMAWWSILHLSLLSLWIINLVVKVTKMIDEGRAAAVVYMDFWKAFDKVLLGRLIQKITKRPQWLKNISPYLLHQLLSHAFTYPIFLFLSSLVHGTGSNPGMTTLEVLFFNVLPKSLYSLHRTLSLLFVPPCTKHFWPFTLPLVNVVQLLWNIFVSGTRKATHYPGVVASFWLPSCS